MADAIGTEWTRAGLALAGALALAALVTGAALADPAPAMRWGAHPGYERIVFDLPEGDDPAVEVRDDSVAIRFNGTARPTISSSWPHGVAAIQADDGRVAITLTAGVRVRQSHLPGRLVLDLLQPVRRNPASTPATPARPPGATGPTAAQPMPSTARGATVLSQTPSELPATTDQPSRKQAEPATSGEAVRAGQDTSLSQEHGSGTEGVPPAAAPQAQQAAILPATPSPEAARGDLLAFLVAPKAADAEAQTATALDIPLGPQVGAAAFRRAAELLVVFDDRRPIDLSRVRQDPTFGPAQVQLLPSATLLRLPLSPDKQMHLVRRPGGWEIAAGNSAAPTKPLAEEFAGDTLTLSSKTANAVVALANDAGGTLLVGTQLSDGEDVVDDQRTPGFGLRPTLQGVVVDPTTDRLTVTATPSGFVVHLEAQELSPRGMDPGTVSLAADHTGSRRFDWTALPEAELRGRLKQAMAAVAAAPPQARLAPRIAAAEAMLALGLADQAEGALEAAVTDTPGAASNPDLLGLRAIAALLLDRPKEAASIDDPSLGSSDDVALWRALKVASENETSAQAAATIAAEWPLVQSYPAPLRERIASLALRTMAFGGRTKQVLQVLTTTPREPALQLARAVALELDPEHAGDPAPAMAAYEALAASADRHSSSYAAYRLIELRLRRGELTPIAAADAMERRLFSWRSERTEPDRRSRIAALRREGGDYRGAIGQLREVASLWPDRSAATKAEMARIFGEAIKSDAAKPMPAIEFVALVEDNPDLVPPGDEGRDIASHVAERLVTLELPRQAIATLAKILAATGPGAARAETGTRLAELNLQEHDPRAALGALDASEAEGLPHDLADRRALARAHAFAALGDPRAALEALATTDTRQGLEFRATLLEQMKDWPNAIAALTEVTGTDVPERGELNDEQARLLLRLASDAAQAGDAATMDRLRARDVPRVRSEAIKGMLSLLTSSPVRARADLPAVGAQEELIRRMPGSLEALNASRSPVR